MSRVHYSATSRDEEVDQPRKQTWAGDLSVSQRSGYSPSYQRNQMYTFSPNDHTNPQASKGVSYGRQNRSTTLLESNVRHDLGRSQRGEQRGAEPRFSMTAGTRSAMISKLRQMGDQIDQLMRKSTTSCQDLTSSLLYLKDIIEDLFIQVNAELEDLKAENQQLKRDEGRLSQDEIRKLEDFYQNKIMRLQSERDQINSGLKRIKGALDKSELTKDELVRKSNKSDQLSRELSILEEEKDRNYATINKLNAKLSEIAGQKQSLKKESNAQDGHLHQIKAEADSTFQAKKELSNQVSGAEAQCAKLQKQIDLLQRKNRDVQNDINYLASEKEKILRQSKQELNEMNDMKGQKNNLSKQIQQLVERLREKEKNEQHLKQDLNNYRRQLDTERRKSGQLGNMHKRYQQEFQDNLNNERDKLGKKLQDYDSRYNDVDRKVGDQLKRSDLLQAEMDKYKKELDNERRKSSALEGDYKRRFKDYDDEKKDLLRKIGEENNNFRRQDDQIKSYNQKLGKCEDLLKDFARQSDLQAQQLRNMKKQVDDERRRTTLAEEEAMKKLKQLALENQDLNRLADNNKQKHEKAIEAMRDYENRFKDAQKRYQDEGRKSELNQGKIKQLLSEMDEERRLSQIDMRDKKQLIKKIEDKNQQLANQYNNEREDFKHQQEAFFNRNKELERHLNESVRQSDLLGQEMRALRAEYENERRKSLAFEEEQRNINERMRELGQKYGKVAHELEQAKDKYKDKEAVCNALQKKHKEIERIFLEQTRKSQLDADQLRMLQEDIDRERRRSVTLEQETLGKIKGLLETHKDMNDNVKQQQFKQQKQLELMQKIEERARQLQRNNAEWARKSDMMANETNKYREELENERRRSLALDSQNKQRIKAMEAKNVELLEKLDQDRDRLGKSEEALKAAQIKYGKIERVLDDERRASEMSKAQFGKLEREYENERKKSTMFEQEASRKIDELLNRNKKMEDEAGSLEERLSNANKTVKSLETKASNAEKTLEQLSRELDQANSEKDRADEAARRLAEQTKSREEIVRRQKEAREQAFRNLKIVQKRLQDGQAEVARIQQARVVIGKQIEEKQRLLAQSHNSNEYLSVTIKQMKESEKGMVHRIQELHRVNTENTVAFEKNYQTLKSQIVYREKHNEQKSKRIEVLQYQASQDTKRILAINPTRIEPTSQKRYN